MALSLFEIRMEHNLIINANQEIISLFLTLLFFFGKGSVWAASI
jgi:hypothetical protein